MYSLNVQMLNTNINIEEIEWIYLFCNPIKWPATHQGSQPSVLEPRGFIIQKADRRFLY